QAHCAMKQKSARRPRGTKHRVFCADVIGELRLEGFAFFPKDVRAGAESAQRSFTNFVVQENTGKRDCLHLSERRDLLGNIDPLLSLRGLQCSFHCTYSMEPRPSIGKGR